MGTDGLNASQGAESSAFICGLPGPYLYPLFDSVGIPSGNIRLSDRILFNGQNLLSMIFCLYDGKHSAKPVEPALTLGSDWQIRTATTAGFVNPTGTG